MQLLWEHSNSLGIPGLLWCRYSRLTRPTSRGAFAVLQRVLNVEGYQVLGLDPDGSTAVLDEDLLREQFGVTP